MKFHSYSGNSDPEDPQEEAAREDFEQYLNELAVEEEQPANDDGIDAMQPQPLPNRGLRHRRRTVHVPVAVGLAWRPVQTDAEKQAIATAQLDPTLKVLKMKFPTMHNDFFYHTEFFYHAQFFLPYATIPN